MRVAILNLMPLKEVTERDFLRLLPTDSGQVELHWIRLRSHVPKHTSPEHMDAFYEYLDEVAQPIDGMIVTGAPVEQLEFEDVTYWPELTQIMDWARENVKSTIYICWAAQAALYHFYGIQKYPLLSKKFGIFPQTLLHGTPAARWFDGFPDSFMMPHSRHTEIRRSDIEACRDLVIVADSGETGPSIITESTGRELYITGHIEYATDTLDTEYRRDQLRGRTDVGLPQHYYPDDDPLQPPVDTWHAAALHLYRNWLSKVIS